MKFNHIYDTSNFYIVISNIHLNCGWEVWGMKDKDFTANNEIISCWIKRALSYLVKAFIVFVVAFIVFTIMRMETLLTCICLE